MAAKSTTKLIVIDALADKTIDLSTKSHYEILGLTLEATKTDIKKTYKKLSIKCHPDKNPSNEERAAEVFGFIFKARETLEDPKKRSAYDAKERRRIEELERVRLRGEKHRIMRERLEQAEERAAESRRRAAAGVSVSAGDEYKKRLQAELQKLRDEFVSEEEQKFAQKRARVSDAKDRRAEAARVAAGPTTVMIRWSRSQGETEEDLRTILEEYGGIVSISVKKNYALVDFQDASVAASVVRDPELEDFNLRASLVDHTSPAGLSALASGQPAAASEKPVTWDKIRPPGLSFDEYENQTLKRMEQVARMEEADHRR